MSRPIIHNLAIAAFALVSFAAFAAANTAHAQVGLDFLNLPPGAEIGDVLSRLYVWGVGLVAIIAVIMLVIGGVQYMVAGEKDPSSAKERIRNAIWGLVLALCSYLILYTINPDLTKKVILKPLEITAVKPPDLGIGEGQPCTGASVCTAGTSCLSNPNSFTDCRTTTGSESGVCAKSCPQKISHGGACQSTAQCGGVDICRIPADGCRQARTGETGQCLDALCQ